MPLSPDLAALIAVTGTACLFTAAWWRGERPRRISKLAKSGALVLDVGTPEQFAAGHAPGAVNIPAADLVLRQGEIGPHTQPVLVYGRGAIGSMLAAQSLRTIGFHAIVCVGTLAQWPRDVVPA